MKKSMKIFSIVIAVIFTITLFMSYIFIAEKLHHDCTGEDCPICMELKEAAAIIGCTKMIPVVLGAIMVSILTIQVCIAISPIIRERDTLITLKVELLN